MSTPLRGVFDRNRKQQLKRLAVLGYRDKVHVFLSVSDEMPAQVTNQSPTQVQAQAPNQGLAQAPNQGLAQAPNQAPYESASDWKQGSFTAQLFDFDLKSPRPSDFNRKLQFSEPGAFGRWLQSELKATHEPADTLNHTNQNNGLLAGERINFAISASEKDWFYQVVSEAKSEMNLSALQKIVPAVFEYGQTTGISFFEETMSLLTSLVEKYYSDEFKGSYAYAYIDFVQHEAVAGLTPEILFSISGKRLETMAVAGTFHDHKNLSREQFINDPKETHEHRLVIEDALEKISKYGPITVGPTSLLRTGKLEHMKTSLSVELNREVKINELIKSMHPTAALGVFPPTALKNWMPRLTSHHRTHFGAPFVFEFDQFSIALVAIRQVSLSQASDNELQIRIGSGCGVVASSNPDSEWEELSQKRQSVRRIFYS